MLRATGLPKMSLITLSLRAIVQKPVEFFLENRERFSHYNPRHGVTKSEAEEDENKENLSGKSEEGAEQPVFQSDDYRHLFNLVNHNETR